MAKLYDFWCDLVLNQVGLQFVVTGTLKELSVDGFASSLICFQTALTAQKNKNISIYIYILCELFEMFYLSKFNIFRNYMYLQSNFSFCPHSTALMHMWFCFSLVVWCSADLSPFFNQVNMRKWCCFSLVNRFCANLSSSS